MKAKRLRRIIAPAVALVLIGLAVLASRRARLYKVTVLPTLGGRTTSPHAINDRGQVVGVAENAAGKRHLFLWDRREGMRDMGPASVFPPYYINNAGQIAGTVTDRSGTTQPSLWDPESGRRLLGTLDGTESFARGLNNSGQVVGHSGRDVRSFRAFIWDRTNGLQSLGTPAKHRSVTLAVNDMGQILGLLFPDPGTIKPVPCRWDSSEPAAMPQLLLSTTYGHPIGHHINNSGYALCKAHHWAEGASWVFLWHKDDEPSPLFPIDITARVLDLNDPTQVLYDETRISPLEWISKKYFPPRTQHCLWDPKRGKVALDSQMSHKTGKLLRTVDLNNGGCIVGVVQSGSQGREFAVLLEPIPERWDK